MKKMIQKLWKDEAGVIISMELVMVGTILVIGITAGLTTLRDAVTQELADLGNAIGSLDQGFGFTSTDNSGGANNAATTGSSAGSQFTDAPDTNDSASVSALTVNVNVAQTAGEATAPTAGT